jgi:protein CpxP
MLFLARSTAPPALSRVLAISMLLGATLLGATSLTSPLLAQTAATPPAVADVTGAKPETVEQRIASLHDKLMITAGEEASWEGVAKVMRENSAAIEKLVVAKKAQMPDKMTAIDDLVTYQAFAQAHVDGLQKLTAVFGTLYNAMPDTQKAVADEVFRKFGRGDGAKRT